MSKGTKICKVCGKEYPYCKTHRSSDVNRYQDVACSYECGQIYFERIKKSREEPTKAVDSDDTSKKKTKKLTKKAESVETSEDKEPVDVEKTPAE